MRRAFTLVELLIVIAIIGLLVSIMTPSLEKAQNLARSTVCRTNLASVGVAFRIYLDQSRDIMPVAAQLPSAQLTDEPSIAEVLKPYLPGKDVLHCPGDNEVTFFQQEGSSYEYQTMLGGKKVGSGFLTRHFRQRDERNTPVMNDYQAFHGKPNEKGAVNFLFADQHVGTTE